jgi:hypothetical protein
MRERSRAELQDQLLEVPNASQLACAAAQIGVVAGNHQGSQR